MIPHQEQVLIVHGVWPTEQCPLGLGPSPSCLTPFRILSSIPLVHCPKECTWKMYPGHVSWNTLMENRIQTYSFNFPVHFSYYPNNHQTWKSILIIPISNRRQSYKIYYLNIKHLISFCPAWFAYIRCLTIENCGYLKGRAASEERICKSSARLQTRRESWSSYLYPVTF